MFLAVNSSVDVLELIYRLHPDIKNKSVSFAGGQDISLGLVETRRLEAVLTASPSLLAREDASVTLRCVKVSKDAVVSLESIQRMKLHFEADTAFIDAMPLFLDADTHYLNLIQHLFMTRLEATLAKLDVTRLLIQTACLPQSFAQVLNLRRYQKRSDSYINSLLKRC